jgi:uncharacterized protein
MLFSLRSLLGLATLGVLLSGCDQEETPAAVSKKEATIRELLELTGASNLATQIMDQMGTAMSAQAGPDFEGFWAEFSGSVDLGEIDTMLVDIYARHFDQAELEELIRFNKTPVGQKVLEEMPAIVRESMAAGMEWGRKLGEAAAARYAEKKAK